MEIAPYSAIVFLDNYKLSEIEKVILSEDLSEHTLVYVKRTVRHEAILGSPLTSQMLQYPDGTFRVFYLVGRKSESSNWQVFDMKYLGMYDYPNEYLVE